MRYAVWLGDRTEIVRAGSEQEAATLAARNKSNVYMLRHGMRVLVYQLAEPTELLVQYERPDGTDKNKWDLGEVCITHAIKPVTRDVR